MTVPLLPDLAPEFELKVDDPEERFIVSSVSWQEYEALLHQLGDSPWYRITYLEGTLEIMSPSRRHERNKSIIDSLLETYFQVRRIPYFPFGSMTMGKYEKKGGTEPDESYCIGTDKEFPDLAIEVILTGGGVDKLVVYKKLGITEVWFWQNNQFSVYHLQAGEYKKILKSELLPDLNLSLLAEYIIKSDPLEAALEFREKIKL